MGHVEHRADAPREVACFVVTCSDTRTGADDRSGALIRDLLKSRDHRLTGSAVVSDDPAAITAAIERAAADPEIGRAHV